MSIGDKATWDTVTGPKVGVIERFDEMGIVIRLPNKKAVIAHESSLKQWKDNSK